MFRFLKPVHCAFVAVYSYPIQLKNAHKHRVIAVAGVLNMAVNNHLVNKAFVLPVHMSNGV